MTVASVLDRTPPVAGGAPALDAEQLLVVAHRRGPLLVLAGPGTGKTTTLVETMVARLSGMDAVPPEQILGLTFGRRAAQDWREQVAARVAGVVAPTVTTFHSFAYSLVRANADPQAFLEPLRLLSGPEQEQRLRELLEHSVRDGRIAWPERLRGALGTRGLAAEVRAVVARAREPWGWIQRTSNSWPSMRVSWGQHGLPWVSFWLNTSMSWMPQASVTTPNCCTGQRCWHMTRISNRCCMSATAWFWWMSSRTATPRRCGCCRD